MERVSSLTAELFKNQTGTLSFCLGAKIRMARIAFSYLNSFTQDKMKSEKKGATILDSGCRVDSLGGQQKV